jgi:hypothetical protein
MPPKRNVDFANTNRILGPLVYIPADWVSDRDSDSIGSVDPELIPIWNPDPDIVCFGVLDVEGQEASKKYIASFSFKKNLIFFASIFIFAKHGSA